MTYIGSLQGSSSGGTSSSGSLSINPGGGISGLSSGINTDAIVTGLVGAAQVPLVHLLQQRQIMQWQQDQYQQVNSSLSTLQNSVTSLQLQSTFLNQTISSSNSSVATATSGSLAAGGTFNLDVTKLAQGATVYSSSALSTDGSNYGSKTLASINSAYANGVTITVNGQQETFQGTDTVASVLATMSSNTAMGVTGFYDANANEVVLQTDTTGSGAMIKADSTTATFFNNIFKISTPANVNSTLASGASLSTNETLEINGQKIQVGPGTSNQTESQIKGAINALTSQTGVVADDSSGTLVLKSNGSLISPISVSDPNKLFGFTSTTSSDQIAQDATYTINGFQSSSPTNQTAYNGVTIQLQATGTTSLTASTNTSSIVSAVTSFVKQFNTSLQLMQGLYNQKRDLSYQPLTSDQASQMTSQQVDQWNQKAQAGLLGNDMLLGNVMNSVESVSTASVSGQLSSNVNGQTQTFDSLAAIGITPIDPYSGVASGNTAPGVTTAGWNSYGVLQMNTQKLTQAIQADPQAVMRLFTNDPTLPGDVSSMSQGIAVQMYNTLQNQVQQLTTQAGAPSDATPAVSSTTPLPSTPIDPNADFTTLFGIDSFDTSSLGQQISSFDTQATDMQTQIGSLRTRYQNEFSHMEGILSSLSTQSSYLSGVSGGTSSTGG